MERGGSDLTGGLACYHVYETRDGGHVTLAALEPEFWATFCRAVGRDDLEGEAFTPALRGRATYEELCELFRGRTRQEWIETLEGVDACCEPVYTVEEALASAPVEALKMLTTSGMLPPVLLSAHESRPAGPAPSLGQHTAALLADLGYGPAEVEKLRREGVV